MTHRLLVAVTATTLATTVLAAPVPKGPPPPAPKAGARVQLASAKLNGVNIQISQSVSVVSHVAVQEVVQQNGQNVTITKVVPQTQQVEQTYMLAIQGTKATTADGQEISDEDLAKKLSNPTAVVQVPANFDPEWKKLFADDVIFLEPKLVARPGGVPIGPPGLGGGPALPPPPPPIPLPPIEKK